MDAGERRRQTNGQAQKASHIEWLFPVSFKNPVQGLTARIGNNQDCPPLLAREGERLGRPGGFEFGCEGVFVFKSSQTFR
jgi:hypothetical protein